VSVHDRSNGLSEKFRNSPSMLPPTMNSPGTTLAPSRLSKKPRTREMRACLFSSV
jgi:hypothetical protein